jgi:DNA-binding SARP family transcriptional activator
LEKAERLLPAVAKYERAVELYRGSYLAEDLYDEWTMIDRQRFTDAYLDALRRLSRYYLDTGQYEKSMGASHRILAQDPCYEFGHRLIMECRVRLGQRTRALYQYRLYEQLLRQMFDARPSREIRDFYAEVLQGENSEMTDKLLREDLD